MAPVLALTQRKNSPHSHSDCRLTVYARRTARLKEQEFYDKHGGLGQRILYLVFSALA